MSDNPKAEPLIQTIIETINERKPRNVKHLVAVAKERFFVTEEKILAAILKLQNQGKIELGSLATFKLATCAFRSVKGVWRAHRKE